ncbi:hypothetical protein LCI18_013413 [Fusarium solani-melongenae]|uniref:Uncharacterized protein n=1 Tax=Fusarium solani subsp. cucurbitae TaxID=2747967 RepID=A0ACD3ZN22_FUSSC|nr:hypothetical protein LCI18_013413 [Fusarium solani-melongenae]
MDDMQEKCGCRKPDITIFEICRSCGNPVNFEELRQQAIDTYNRDGRPIEDPNLPRRYLLMGNPKNSLRLLHLDDDASPILSGTFERASIAHLPPYEAVSYCWGGDDGDYTKSEFIIIGGRLFPITKNCAAVLRKIRKKNSKRVIWIDSLCINQNDVNERSVQVSQMGLIFSGAQKVHIYLGNNVDNTTVSEAFYVLGSMQNLQEFSMRLRDRAESVKALFTQTYFSRMWIIQEVLLAKSAQLHWGTTTIPWQTLSEGHLDVLRWYGIHSHIPEWMRIRAMTNNFRNSETLGELLFSAMGSTASNDRDKVYGIYGLLFDAEEEGLIVDYGLSVKQVFTNMAVHLITKHSAFRAILPYVNHDAPSVDGEQLPSWVPDFRSRCVPKHVTISFDGYNDLKIHSRISSEEAISNIGTNELYLRGHRLRIFPGRDLPDDECSKVVKCKIGEQDLEWKIEAKFSVDFDPKEHTVFWMPNGLILHLKRSRTLEDTYTLLGECALKHSGPFPTLVVHNRRTSFADAMFGLELQDLAPLWKIYLDFKGFFVRSKMSDEYKPFSQTGVNMEDANEAASKYRDFCSRDEFNEYRRQIHNNRQKSTVRRWMFGLREIQKPNDEGTFGQDEDSDDEDSDDEDSDDEMLVARGQRDSQIERMIGFESFWEVPGTWERLHSLKTVLQHPESYDIQKINDLCSSWLQHYEEAIRLIWLRDFRRKSEQYVTLATRFLEKLEAWETVTEKLSEALQWAEGFFWLEEPPSVRDNEDSSLILPVSKKRKAPTVNNDDEDGEVGDSPNGGRRDLRLERSPLLSDGFAGRSGGDRDDRVEGARTEQSKAEEGPANGSPHDKKIMPNWLIENNFKAVRVRWEECQTSGGRIWKPNGYVLEPWSDGWVEAIWSIPNLFAAKDQVNLEELFQLEERCLKHGAWRGVKMEICQAETITLV